MEKPGENTDSQCGTPRGRENSMSTVCTSQMDIFSTEKEYNPYEHRNVKHPTSYFETLINLAKCSLGTGVLAMPYAFANAGYIVGIIGTILIGVLCIHAVHIMIASEYEMCKRQHKPSMTYPETLKAAVSEGPGAVKKFSDHAPFVCNLFLLMYEIGSCSVYVIFIATNIKDVVDNYQSPENRFDIRLYCVFILIPLLVINAIRNYKYLAPLSAFGTIAGLISYVIVIYYLFSGESNMSNSYPVAAINQMPLFFGTVLFALEAIPVVFPLENEMKNPQNFRGAFGVINGAMVPITIIYMSVGLLGFLSYGGSVAGTVTSSLPQSEILSQGVRLLLSLVMYISHAIMLHPAIDTLWYEYFRQYVKDRHNIYEFVLRVITVLVTFILAVAVPYLELFISLLGALCMSMLGLMFPALIETFIFWDHFKGLKSFLFLLKNLVIAVIALFGLVFGVISSLEGILQKFSEDYGF